MREKTPEEDPIAGLLVELRTDINSDRERLSGVLDKLIEFGKTDPDRLVAVAETIAKLGDAMTKQNHLRVDAIKALARRNPRGDDKPEDPFDDIGSAFEHSSREN